MHTGSHVKRQKFLLVLLCLMWVVLVVKLGKIQFIEHDGYHTRVLDQRIRPISIKAQRGRILDRNGVMMAVSRSSSSYGVSPQQIDKSDETIRALSGATGKNFDDINRILASKSKFRWLVRQAEPSVIEKLDILKINGLHKHSEFRRYYPLGRIGTQIIGITNVDTYGIEGCELYFNDDLMGRDGRSTLLKDAKGKSARSLDEPIVKPQNGLDIVLTIDWRLQEIAEEELETCVQRTGAQWGGVIIIDSDNGEILAMANVPGFEPNHVRDTGEIHKYLRNRLVTDMIEPGSIFKVVVFAEALESGLLNENDLIDCGNGKYRVSNHIINDSHKLGVVQARDVLVNSSNVGTVKIAEKIGKKKLYERACRMGFGEVTGIDFPNETPGRLFNPRKWSKLSLPTISFGQGVAVSSLQIALAYAAIANGGELMTPRIVKEIRGSDERPGYKFKPQKIRRAMSPQTAMRLTKLLEYVVKDGTGKKAALHNVCIAGKTGTAQRSEEGKKGYIPGRYVSSFIGFATGCKKKIVCLVVIDSPRVGYYGSQVAAPVFRNIMNKMLNLSGTYWENMLVQNGSDNKVKNVLVPDLKGQKISEAVAQLRLLGLHPEVYGDSTVVAQQTPLGGAKINIGMNVKLYSNAVSTDRTGHISVPDLIGKSMREAVQNLVQANLNVSVLGSGIVTAQNPRAGTLVNHGTECMIECSKR